MHLKRMTLTDFLSVKGAISIDVDRRVTIILGSNDHGKTNLLVAMQHLNEEVPMLAEETNWDAVSEPRIDYDLEFSEDERRAWAAIAIPLLALPASGTPSSDAGAQLTEAPIASPVLTDQESAQIDELRRLGHDRQGITVSRKGIGTPLSVDGTPIEALPPDIAKFIKSRIPRIELFRSLTGDIQDSVTADQINTEPYEFLQGIFFYAGIKPSDAARLFVQDDSTMRALDNASEVLDGNLRKLWGQGTDLHFRLRHKANTIEFLADDPAIKNRMARMSKRSAGVTQFFRASMILYARQMKNPASSYIYLFDEPGVYLHPQGQRDLMQVFEQLSEQTQIVYVTHSLFLLNQNFPERHRLLTKDEQGTKVDQKPYRANWRLATDALGVYVASNILFCSRVLLVEGDSDPLYIYELIRQMNRIKETDIDINALGIMSFYDIQNLRFLLQVFRREGQAAAVMVLTDGDAAGKTISERIRALADRLRVPLHSLADAKSVEDYCLSKPLFTRAVAATIRTAAEAEQKQIPDDLDKEIETAWNNRDLQATGGRWFKDFSKEKLGDEASKIALARSYVFSCREQTTLSPAPEDLAAARKLIQDIRSKLDLPGTRAERVIEGAKRV